jgi:superfamily II DNA or RNA helicase
VAELTDPEIAQQVGSRTFERGEAYAAQRRVRSIASRPDGLMLLGTVEGSGDETYQTIVTARPHPKGRSHLWTGRCSCPVEHDCKHAVALLLTARTSDSDVGEESTAPAAPSGEVHWAAVLGQLRDEPVEGEPPRRPLPRGDEVPAGLFVDLTFSPTSWGERPEPSWVLRPTRWTRTGTWHRKLTWAEALPRWGRGARYLPEHEDLMARLNELGRRSPALRGVAFAPPATAVRLESDPGVWGLLAEAHAAGIEIMPGEGVPGEIRVLDASARLVAHLMRADDESDDLVLRVELDLPEDALGQLHLVGSPVHGVVVEGDDGSLTLMGLEQSLGLDRSGLLAALHGLRIPAAERGDFLRTVVPRLRRRARVRSQVPLPVPDEGEVAPEAVTVHVRVVADVPGEVRLELGHAYAGRLRPFATARFGGGGVRDREAEDAAVEAASSVRAIPGAVHDGGSGRLLLVPHVTLRGLEAARFAIVHLPALEADEHVTLEVDGLLATYEEITSAPLIRLGAEDPGERGETAGSGDWFDLHVSVEVDGEEVPFEPLFSSLARGEEIMLLESGSWFRLDRPELVRLRDLIEEAREIADPESGGLRLSAHHADFWDELVALGVVDRQSARWAASVEALGSLEEGPQAEVPVTLRATLRPYQVEGFRWLSRLWDARLGGILADDMGLGKTLQVIAALARAQERGELGNGHGPALVVAPTSVVGTWLSEFERFAPHLRVVVVGETERRRGRPLSDTVADAEVVITSYAVLRLDDVAFHALPWSGVVLDEAQFVKNRQAKTHVAVRKLGAPFTIAVTGTPLENSLMDLWALLSLTAPGLYPRPDVFTKNYRKPIESGARPELLDLLRRRIRPLMLRRTKEQVAIDLPPKQIQVLPVPHHPVHQHIYDQHLARERQRVLGLLADPESNRVAILAALTRLRQLALDPALVDDAHAGKATAAKVELLVEQLRELAAEGHRALVFSQFTGFLKVVERALDAAGLRTCYLDGATANRQQVIRSFRDGQAAAFLISLKAGGFGLTLTEADYVFVLDPWWNPAAEAQAIDRAHRIGQDKPVMVYRLVTAGTIEEKVVALQERKRDLFQRVVDEGGSLSGAITADDVRDLLGPA